MICKGSIFYDYLVHEKKYISEADKLLRRSSYHDFYISSCELLVYDDVKIEFYHDNSNKAAFKFWFNTMFVE